VLNKEHSFYEHLYIRGTKYGLRFGRIELMAHLAEGSFLN